MKDRTEPAWLAFALALVAILIVGTLAVVFLRQPDPLLNISPPLEAGEPCLTDCGSDFVAPRGEPGQPGVEFRLDGEAVPFAGLTVIQKPQDWLVVVQLGTVLPAPSAGPYEVVASDGEKTFKGPGVIVVREEPQGTVLYVQHAGP
jgi:hypothetical protein